MNARELPGVHFRSVFFEPTFQKHARETCGGCQPHVTDRQAFLPVRTAVELIEEFRKQNPSRFAWRQPPYEYELEKQPIDLLYGNDRLRATIDNGQDMKCARRELEARGRRVPSAARAVLVVSVGRATSTPLTASARLGESAEALRTAEGRAYRYVTRGSWLSRAPWFPGRWPGSCGN